VWGVHRGAYGVLDVETVIGTHDGSAGAADWTAATLAEVAGFVGPSAEFHLPAWDAVSRGALRDRGLGVLYAHLAGPARGALDALVAAYDPPLDLRRAGLDLRLATPDDAEAVSALDLRVFSEEPIFAWFAVLPAFRDGAADRVREGLAHGLTWLVLRDGALVGQGGGSLRDPDVHCGSSIGVGMVLDRSIRGRGVVHTLYRLCLEGAVGRGARFLKGTTGRRSVLRLGGRMGRQATGVIMRREHLDDGRFDATLRAAERAAS
jgi:hypothetical protein